MVKSTVSLIVICITAYSTFASPVPNKKDKRTDFNANVLYDQRQEGEWNVRAHLDNFLIMVIPTHTIAEAANPTLLDLLLSKSIPKGSHLKRIKHVKKQQAPDTALETQHFIESKTAPYHVDLTKPSADVKPTPTEEVVVANSPSIKVLKADATIIPSHTRSARISRHFVFTIPTEEEYIATRNVEPKSVLRKHKKTIKEKPKAELKLLGAENEQCGPDLVRDSYGICTVLKH
ncbi:uncharacterized protein LOC130444829 [Diorhabda sublineata]|uniref:uncharacterized protein LOC130444829 n=1 Tax=Diorhabda sublineata TaxID=1163346 RepID=UPI0024E069E6|nr:uncharacterized protein LOC130444829 [Diorhabda sublineata]